MRLAAVGDCHIGSYAKKIDEGTGLNARLLDTVKSLEFVIRDANARGVDEILFAGDMFRNSKPTPTELVMAVRVLSASQAPVIMIPGNHDLPRGINEHSAVEPLAHRASNVIGLPKLHEGVGYQLATLPYPNRAQLAAALPEYASLSPEDADALIGTYLEQILQGFRAQLDPSKPSVLLAHLSIDAAEVGAERSIMAGRDITIPLSAIPEEFTFAVFGHIHKAQDFGAYGRPNVLYTGSTDRIDFGEEGEEKSYVILDLEAGTWERVPIPCREYRTLYYLAVPDGRDAWAEKSLDCARGAICRVKVTRPENVRIDYGLVQGELEEAGCFDFRGFTEDVQRTAMVRSEEIVRAQSLEELLGIWHEAKNCEVPLGDLVAAGTELEGMVA